MHCHAKSPIYYKEKKVNHGAGELPQLLRAPATLAKDLGSVPRIYMAANNWL